MTDNQKVLYEFLEGREGRYTHLIDVARALGIYPPFERTRFGYSSAKRMITADVQAINESGEVDRIIISNTGRGLMLGGKDDTKLFLSKRYKSLWETKKRLDTLSRRVGLTGQFNFDGGVVDTYGETRHDKMA